MLQMYKQMQIDIAYNNVIEINYTSVAADPLIYQSIRIGFNS